MADSPFFYMAGDAPERPPSSGGPGDGALFRGLQFRAGEDYPKPWSDGAPEKNNCVAAIVGIMQGQFAGEDTPEEVEAALKWQVSQAFFHGLIDEVSCLKDPRSTRINCGFTLTNAGRRACRQWCLANNVEVHESLL